MTSRDKMSKNTDTDMGEREAQNLMGLDNMKVVPMWSWLIYKGTSPGLITRDFFLGMLIEPESHRMSNAV